LWPRGALERLQSRASQPPSVARAMRRTICEAKVRGVTCKLEDVTDQLSSDKRADKVCGPTEEVPINRLTLADEGLKDPRRPEERGNTQKGKEDDDGKCVRFRNER
jgi:hypothetical protein